MITQFNFQYNTGNLIFVYYTFFTEQNSTQLTSKIIGGQTLPPELYSYVIKFKYKPKHTSTAVLISRSLIMSTARCIQGLEVHDLNKSYVEIPNIFIREGNIFYIQEILIDGFDRNLPVPLGDFAVLRVSNFDIQFSN